MKRLLVIIALVSLMLAATSVVFAQDLAIEVDGGMLMGKAKQEVSIFSVENDLTSLFVSADVTFAEPFGARIGFISHKVEGYEADNRIDLLATYQLPLDEFALTAFGGFTRFGDADFSVKGFLVGVEGEQELADKIGVFGSVGLGLSIKDSHDDALSLLDFEVGGTYALSETLLAQCGYSLSSYSYSDMDLKISYGGFFVGVKATF